MQIEIFTIYLSDMEESIKKMNSFLNSHKVIEMEQKFFQSENGGAWSFCVRYIMGSVPIKNTFAVKTKVDYRETLEVEHFVIFNKLREIRKALAVRDGIPAFAIFTDEELSNIAKLPELKVTEIKKINGIGENKVNKYGIELIKEYKEKSHLIEKKE